MFINNKRLTYIRNERLLLKKPQNTLFREDTKNIHLKNSALKNAFYKCFHLRNRELQWVIIIDTTSHDNLDNVQEVSRCFSDISLHG